MRIISLNLNGIRSACNKGVMGWLAAQHADAVCVQELKAQQADLGDVHLRLIHDGRVLTGHFHAAQKKGYSGVGLYLAGTPARMVTGMGVSEFDDEGRVLRADIDADGRPLSVVSVYLPSGSASPERQASKFRFLEAFAPVLAAWMGEHRRDGREFVVCGDWNIAHREIDLKNWKGNLKNSGFLPEERAWLDQVYASGWVDVYRQLHPDAGEEGYTWWSQRGQAYAKNVGWRIDLQLATPGIAARAKSAHVFKGERFSDHAPLVVDYGE